jgi:iron-sulfur cluster assembly protein
MKKILKNNIPITFTNYAIDEIKKLYLEGGYSSDFGLRLGVKGGGCSGFSYIFEFDSRKENDIMFVVEGVSIYIDISQELYLYNCQIDYKDGLENRGFIFNNPNALEKCGCGTSFSI